LKPLPTTALYYRWLKWARTWGNWVPRPINCLRAFQPQCYWFLLEHCSSFSYAEKSKSVKVKSKPTVVVLCALQSVVIKLQL